MTKTLSAKLISSMNMNEKRYFKIYCKRHTIGSQNKYEFMFTLLNKNSSLDDDTIKESLLTKRYKSKNLSSDFNYLNKLILRSLNEFNLNKTTDLKVKSNMISIEIMFLKGLYDECLKLIDKTKRIIKLNENGALMLDLLNWEKKCLGYSKGFYSAMALNNTIDLYFKSYSLNRTITDLYYQSYYLKNNVDKISSDVLLKEIEVVKNNTLIVNGINDLMSIKSRVFFYLIFSNFYFIEKNLHNELLFLEKTIHVFNNNIQYKKENPLDYISIYIRIIDIHRNHESSIFYEKINMLRSLDSTLSFKKDVIEERIFFHTSKAELEHFIFNNNISVAHETMIKTKETILKNKYKIEPFYYIDLYYIFACIHFFQKNISASLKFVNTIFNEYKLKQKPSVYIKTEIMNIIIHFELQNYDVVLYKIEGFRKKYLPIFKINPIEKKIINIISKISKNPHSKIKLKEFKKLSTELDALEISASKVSNCFYLNYVKSNIS